MEARKSHRNSEEVAICPLYTNGSNDLSPLPLGLSTQKACQYEQHRFDWLNSNWDSYLELPISDSPKAGTAAKSVSQAAGRVR